MKDSEPFTPEQITYHLRGMSAERLAASHPYDFQRWPVRKIVPAKVIHELITNERQRRK